MKALGPCKIALCAATLCAYFTAGVRGQSIQGSIVGAVADASGAAVASAKVVVTNEGKNFERIGTT